MDKRDKYYSVELHKENIIDAKCKGYIKNTSQVINTNLNLWQLNHTETKIKKW